METVVIYLQAKMVAAATHSLCEAANAIVQGQASLLELWPIKTVVIYLQAKMVAAATHSLCEAANAMVQDRLVC